MPSSGECIPCGGHFAHLGNHIKSARHLRLVALAPALAPILPQRKRGVRCQHDKLKSQCRSCSERCEHNKIKSSCTTCSAHLFTWCDRCLSVCRTGGAFDRHLQTTLHHTVGLLTYPGPADVGPHVWDTERFMPPLGPQMPPGMKYKSDVFGIDPATGRLVLVRWA